jgi:hypothetical protein
MVLLNLSDVVGEAALPGWVTTPVLAPYLVLCWKARTNAQYLSQSKGLLSVYMLM